MCLVSVVSCFMKRNFPRAKGVCLHKLCKVMNSVWQ